MYIYMYMRAGDLSEPRVRVEPATYQGHNTRLSTPICVHRLSISVKYGCPWDRFQEHTKRTHSACDSHRARLYRFREKSTLDVVWMVHRERQ